MLSQDVVQEKTEKEKMHVVSVAKAETENFCENGNARINPRSGDLKRSTLPIRPHRR